MNFSELPGATHLALADAWASASLAAGGSLWDYKKSSDIMANINQPVYAHAWTWTGLNHPRLSVWGLTCSNVIYLCGGALVRPDWQASPVVPVILPHGRNRSYTSVPSKWANQLWVEINSHWYRLRSFFFFFFNDIEIIENILLRNIISIKMERWSIWNINKWSPREWDHRQLICHQVKYHLKRFLSLSFSLSICPSYRTHT